MIYRLLITICLCNIAKVSFQWYVRGGFYNLVSIQSRFPFLLGCLSYSRTMSFCFSFGHVARYDSPLRSFIENQIYGTIAANTLQGNLQHPPLIMRRFSANLSYFSDFAELQTHNKNRLALHINRTNFLKATKTEESVSTPKFDGRKTNAPTSIG